MMFIDSVPTLYITSKTHKGLWYENGLLVVWLVRYITHPYMWLLLRVCFTLGVFRVNDITWSYMFHMHVYTQAAGEVHNATIHVLMSLAMGVVLPCLVYYILYISVYVITSVYKVIFLFTYSYFILMENRLVIFLFTYSYFILMEIDWVSMWWHYAQDWISGVWQGDSGVKTKRLGTI